MTVGSMFTDLLRLLEIGDCCVSTEQYTITVRPFYGEEFSRSPRKQLLTLVLQRGYTKVARQGLFWEAEINPWKAQLVGEILRVDLLQQTGFSVIDREMAEQELLDVLHSHIWLEEKRLTARST